MPDPIPDAVVCLRLLDQPRKPASFATTATCSKCGTAVWVGPSSKPALAAGAVLECLPCAQQQEYSILPLTAAQQAELLRLQAERHPGA